MLFGHGDAGPGAFLPIAIVVIVLIARNARPRRLRIETLWIWPTIYLALLIGSLYEAPPPITTLSIGLLVLAALIGAAIGWQRGRFAEIRIHPETHDISSRQPVVGLIFILGVFAVRYFAGGLLAENAATLHLPVIAATDAFFVLAISMLVVQRLELWLRASQMLADAKRDGGPPFPPTDLVR